MKLAVLSRKYCGHEKSVKCLVDIDDHSLFWTADSKGQFKIRDWNTFDIIKEGDSMCGRTMAMCYYKGHVWIGSSSCIQVFSYDGVHIKAITKESIAFAPYKDEVWSSSLNGLEIYDATTF